VIVGSGDGRTFRIGPQVATVKAEGDGGPAVVETLLPEGSGAPRHLHHDHDETFYVVSGTLVVDVDGEVVTVGPGGLARATRGIAHSFRNPGPGDAVVLAMYDPAPSLEYLELLGAAFEMSDVEARGAFLDDLYRRFSTESA
jgi:mannose-6-phosphate isomerase-like protein (cupin superfamily)